MINQALFTLIFLFTSFAVIAADSPEKGKELIKAWNCVECHGLTGNDRSTSEFPRPMLAGQPAAFISMRLRQYRDGVLFSAQGDREKMEKMVRGLSDQDIADIAAYFEIQKRY